MRRVVRNSNILDQLKSFCHKRNNFHFILFFHSDYAVNLKIYKKLRSDEARGIGVTVVKSILPNSAPADPTSDPTCFILTSLSYFWYSWRKVRQSNQISRQLLQRIIIALSCENKLFITDGRMNSYNDRLVRKKHIANSLFLVWRW